MADYSVATTRDNLSSLIDKALAGEDVRITRYGKPTARIVADAPEQPMRDVRAATERLRERLAGLPSLANRGRPLMEQIKDEYSR
jgi:prevent-host-death family protein